MLTSKCSEVGCDAALPPAGEKFKNIIIIQEKSGLQDLDYTECVNEYFYFILFIKVIIYFFLSYLCLYVWVHVLSFPGLLRPL